MKKNYVFLFVIAFFVISCNVHDDDIVDNPPVVNHDMDISVRIIWSDDLLYFLTPILTYTDAEGVHQMIVEDTMTVDDIWEIDGELYDFHSQSWDYDFTYVYRMGDTVRLSLQYLPKEHTEIIDTEVYTFDHQFNVSQVSMMYTREDGKNELLNISNVGAKDAYEERQCIGSEVRQYLDSLVSFPYELKIFLCDNELIVE